MLTEIQFLYDFTDSVGDLDLYVGCRTVNFDSTVDLTAVSEIPNLGISQHRVTNEVGGLQGLLVL